jgi:D-alanyl-D-alanine dipeptidase
MGGPLLALLLACGPTAPRAAGPSAPGGPSTPPTIVDSRAPSGFVVLSDVDSSILSDIRYASPHNFVGHPIDGYPEPLCILTRTAAQALHRVQQTALARGYTVKVYDCYRPQRAVDEFVAWAKRPDDQTMKAEFYPDVPKADLFADGYIGAPTAHSRGSTMDLTLVSLPPRPQPAFTPGQPLVSCVDSYGKRFPDNSVDVGTGFDCFDPLAHTGDPRVTGQPRANRVLLRDLMSAQGFVNYPDEWWHYSLANEPFPRTYFNFPVARSAVPPS